MLIFLFVSDLVYLNNDNHSNLSSKLSKYKRQLNNNKEFCEIPYNPLHTKYKIFEEAEVNYKPRDHVKTRSILETICDKGYNLILVTHKISVCRNGKWNPTPTICSRACSSLTSTSSTIVKCHYKGTPLNNCLYPVDDTRVTLSCSTFYEEASVAKNPIHVCKNGKWIPPIPQCYPSCGMKTAKGKPNIVNGRNATTGDYPWQIGIYEGTGKDLICGGSIIDQHAILTAAHCLTDHSGNAYPTTNFFIGAGKYYRNYQDDRDQLAQYSNVLAIHVPEKYKGPVHFYANDIAVVILSDPLTLSEVIQPVCIELNEAFHYLDFSLNKNGIVTGWGYTEEGRKLSEVLKELHVPYIPYEKCYHEVPENFRRYMTTDKICAGFTNSSTSICGGDSGGGLTLKDVVDNRYYLKGIVSTSPATVELVCDSNAYSLYTAISHHINFVRDHVYQQQPSVECTEEECIDQETESRNSCLLPNFPANGKYILFPQNIIYTPGDYVPLQSTLVLSCGTGVSDVSSSHGSQSYCTDNGQWVPAPKTCKSSPTHRITEFTESTTGSIIEVNKPRFAIFKPSTYSNVIRTRNTCPSLIPNMSTNVSCVYNNKTLDNCTNPLEGTEAYLFCNEFYEEGSIEINPTRLCKEGKWDGPIPQCFPICGVKRPNLNEDSQREKDDHEMLLEYPWHVGIYNDTKNLICEGTLIAMNLVLTAAHCVIYEDDFPINLTKNTFVASGKSYLEYLDKRDKFSQYSKVEKIEVPSAYNGLIGPYYAFDIAIVFLENPFLPSQVVQPICITFNSLLESNQILEDSGMGTSWDYPIENTTYPDVLQKSRVFFGPQPNCKDNLLKFLEDNFITFDKICGTYANNDISCHRTLGGGLFFKSVINSRFYITGITESQVRVNGSCENIYYSIYTSVFEHLGFLRSHIANKDLFHYCQLPSFPQHGKYVFMNKGNVIPYKFGYPVPPFSEITLICDIGYISASLKFNCSQNGEWTPTLEECLGTYLATHSEDIESSSSDIYFIIIAAVVLLVIAVAAIIILKLKLHKEKKIRGELKLVGLDHFREGDLKKFDPELGIGDQAEFLPYNNKYEFPKDKLELGKQIRSGTFGIVMKATAFGITAKEERTTVAVKTVKNMADNIQIKALITELKIMVHLGMHLNVVNLLGACTENITKRELFIIVEYCHFGNLRNYLLQNCRNYIDQIDRITGTIDYSIGSEDSENILSTSINDSVSISGSNILYKKDACEPRTNYNEYNKKTITTKDLISWSFQVARGMEYLSSRKVIHGDLAARNILLAENNIVKICDFGLAKSLYQNINYKKQKDCPLEIKWMAAESIRDSTFSTESDVWSYGIVLWEFFSLAQTPYPGMEVDKKLYDKLKEGYQMESPPYAPKEMYKIMCDCWTFTPESRPSFNKLVGSVGLMLEENVRLHYINLNDPYMVINTQRLHENQMDYLAILGSNKYIDKNIMKDSSNEASENVHNASTCSAADEVLEMRNKEEIVDEELSSVS